MTLKYLNLIKDELESEFRRGLEVTLEKCNLVTRKEFDIQTEVLAKTRDKLEKLTQKITMLEEKLKKTHN